MCLCRSLLLEDLVLPFLFNKFLLNCASFPYPMFRADQFFWLKSIFNVECFQGSWHTCLFVFFEKWNIYKKIVGVNSNPTFLENGKYVIYLSMLLTAKAECSISVFFYDIVQNRFRNLRWCLKELIFKTFYLSVTLAAPRMQQVVLARSYTESLWKWRGDGNKGWFVSKCVFLFSISIKGLFPPLPPFPCSVLFWYFYFPLLPLDSQEE